MKTQSKDPIKITMPTPYLIGDVHSYLIKGDRLTLIDAGVCTKEAKAVLAQSLAEAGYTLNDIEQVIITHHHPDHIGLLDVLKADVFGHEYSQSWLSGDPVFFLHQQHFFNELMTEFGLPAEWKKRALAAKETLHPAPQQIRLTGFLKEGDFLPGLAEWKVIETPGHAQSHLVFYNQTTGALIGGDHILQHVSSSPLIEPPFCSGDARPKPLLQYQHSLNKMLDLDILEIFPGHGNNIQAVKPLLQKRFERQKQRAEKVLGMLKKRPMTVFEVCRQLFPEMWKKQLSITMSETVGQIDYLTAAGAIKVDRKERGAVYYREVAK